MGTALTFNPSAKDALCSLDSLREGESEYIRHQVNRILDLKPDIILVSPILALVGVVFSKYIAHQWTLRAAAIHLLDFHHIRFKK